MSKKRKLSDSDCDSISNKESPKTASNSFDLFAAYKFYHYNKVPHHLLPSFNYSKTKSPDEVFLEDEQNFQIGPPCSVYVTGNLIPNVDLCCKRVATLNNYLTQLKRLRTFYITSRKKNKVLRKAEKKNVYPRSLINFIEKLDQHPDPYFNARYDFYYTGGNLAILHKDNYVVHSSGEYLDNLNISKFNVSNGMPKIELVASLPLKDNNNTPNEIFEIQTVQSHNRIIFKTRCQHKIQIHYFSKQKIKLLCEFASEIPFISFAQNKCSSNILVTSNLKQEIRVWDLEASKNPISKINFNRSKAIDNNWNTIKAYSRNTYIYAGLNELCVWDIRVPIKEIKSNFCAFNYQNEKCAHISSLEISKFENLFYIGSTHKLQCLDVRFMKRELSRDDNTVLEWTHQMELAPLMMNTSKNNNNEQIFLASAKASDVRICDINRNAMIDNLCLLENSEASNQHNHVSYSTNNLPFMPPTYMDFYKQARIRSKCINPALNIKERINRCNTGLSVYQNDKDVFLLIANSIGDIFAHKLKNSTSEENNSSTQFIEEYEKSIEYLNVKEPMKLTTVADLSPIREVFCSNTFINENPFPSIKNELSGYKRMGRWQKPIQTLLTYKDALASDILAIWDVDFKTEQNGTLQETLTSTNLVTNWLDNHSSTMLPESLIVPTPSNAGPYENNSSLKTISNGFLYESNTSNLKMSPNEFLDENKSVNLNNVNLTETINNISADHTKIDFTSQKSTSKVIARNKYVKGF